MLSVNLACCHMAFSCLALQQEDMHALRRRQSTAQFGRLLEADEEGEWGEEDKRPGGVSQRDRAVLLRSLVHGTTPPAPSCCTPCRALHAATAVCLLLLFTFSPGCTLNGVYPGSTMPPPPALRPPPPLPDPPRPCLRYRRRVRGLPVLPHADGACGKGQLHI